MRISLATSLEILWEGLEDQMVPRPSAARCTCGHAAAGPKNCCKHLSCIKPSALTGSLSLYNLVVAPVEHRKCQF